MASAGRSDRQLMRQRGAGLRNVQNLDFGFKIGTQPSREERQLMRQRGAGNRDVGNVDFGFSFPTPNQSRRSSRTPRTTRSDGVRRSKTPVRSSGERPPHVTRSSEAKQARLYDTTQYKPSGTPKSAARAEVPNSSKRRRLGESNANIRSPNIVINIPRTSEHHLYNPRFVPPRLGNNIDARERFDVAEDLLGDDVVADMIRSDSPLFFPEGDDKENGVLSVEQKGPRTSRLTSLNQPSRSRVDENIPSQAALDPSYAQSTRGGEDTQSVRDDVVESIGREGDARSSEVLLESLRSSHDTAAEVTASRPDSGTEPSRRRKKRKSVVLGRRRRRSASITSWNVAPPSSPHIATARSASVLLDASKHDDSMQDVTAEDTAHDKLPRQPLPLWKQLIAGRARSRRGRLSVSASPEPAGVDRGDDDDSYVEDDNTPEPITPAPKKNARNRRVQGLSKTRARAEKGQQATKQTFPITVHRMANSFALPTICEQEEHGDLSGAESSSIPATFSNRAQPNVVDVLAQICRETVGSALKKLEEGEKATRSRAESKQKRTALEAFGENLNQRLFDMSQAVEHRMTLESRLRKSKRELAELQTRWINVRRQRDELALQADNIRRQNWEDEEQKNRQWKISELAYDTELALEEDWSDEDNLELTLRSVAEIASTKGGRHGLLRRVQGFNSRLERVATMLEGR